jgi:hypothetical protein
LKIGCQESGVRTLPRADSSYHVPHTSSSSCVIKAYLLLRIGYSSDMRSGIGQAVLRALPCYLRHNPWQEKGPKNNATDVHVP